MARLTNPEQTILTSAYRLFHRHGFNRVSMDEIAAAAGVTKRTLYYHFRSKDSLLAAVLHQVNVVEQLNEPPEHCDTSDVIVSLLK